MKRNDRRGQMAALLSCVVALYGGLITGPISTARATVLGAPATESSEPLGAERAFVPTAKRVSSKLVEFRYDIAPAHYMYKDRFRVRLALSDVASKAQKVVGLPDGKVAMDPTFGRVETYRRSVTFRVPTGPSAGKAVELTSQGCAEIGICYPPVIHRFLIGEVGVAVSGEVVERDAVSPFPGSSEPAAPGSLRDLVRAPTRN